jgi:hypothetical protein
MAAVLYWRLPELALTTQVRCPGSPAFHQRCCITIPSGATTWQSDPNSSQTSPARFKTRPGKVTPRQLGHHREVTPAPPSSAKLQCGGPPTASIPKTHDQPEEANSKHFRPSRNNASTGTSPIPPIRHAARGPTSDRHEAPPVAAITTGSAHTETRTASQRAVRATPIAHPKRQIATLGTRGCTRRGHGRQAHRRIWLFS